MGLRLLGGLTAERNLPQYWQKKPLLVRQAIPAPAGIVQSSESFRPAACGNVQSKLLVPRRLRCTARAGLRNRLMLFSLRHRWYLHGWPLIGERHG